MTPSPPRWGFTRAVFGQVADVAGVLAQRAQDQQVTIQAPDLWALPGLSELIAVTASAEIPGARGQLGGALPQFIERAPLRLPGGAGVTAALAVG